MNYKLLVTPIAQQQIEESYLFYKNRASKKVADKFLNSVKKAYKILRSNPFFEVRIKNYRAIPVNDFPFLVFFELDEMSNIVKILAIFNTYKNTDKYPK